MVNIRDAIEDQTDAAIPRHYPRPVSVDWRAAPCINRYRSRTSHWWRARMTDQQVAPSKPLSAFWFVLAGLLLGLASGFISGALLFYAVFTDAFLRWLTPQVGATSFLLGVFIHDLVIFPIMMAATVGFLLPLGYVYAKTSKQTSMSVARWLACVCVTLVALTLWSFAGTAKWYVLVPIHVVPALILGGLLTVFLVKQFNSELAKLGTYERT